MSVHRLVGALCICSCAWAFTNLAIAAEQSTDFSSAGKAEATDVGYTPGHDCGKHDGCNSDCCNHDCEGDHVCDCADDCDGAPNWHWIGGVEATYLDPRFHASGNPQADTTLRTIDPSWTAAPRIWLGVENADCWGAQVRYWQLDAQRHRFNITDVQPDTVFDGTQSLTMYDIDAEITKRWDLDCWNVWGSFGGRYGSLERLVTSDGFETVGPANSFGYIFDNRTNAGGLTESIGLARHLGDSSWEVFGCFRASQLWGDTNAIFDSRGNFAGTPVIDNASIKFNSNLTIWEAQTGVQCSKHVDCLSGTVLARCAFEYQSWNWSVPGGNLGGGAIFNPGVELYGVAFAVGFTH